MWKRGRVKMTIEYLAGNRIRGTTAERDTLHATNLTISGGTESTYSYGGTNYKLHKFTSNGTFTINGNLDVDVLVVAGGGGGGDGTSTSWEGGGGGAGGLRFINKSLTSDSYSIVIGNGGDAGDGTNSSFDNNGTFDITSTGGGYGGSGIDDPGNSGGSGGGGTHNGSSGGSGNAGGYTPVEGYDGGNGGNSRGAGGGGSGGAGSTAPSASTSGTTGGLGSSTFVNSSTAETTAFLLGAVAGTDSSNVATTTSSTGTLYIASGGGAGRYGIGVNPGGASEGAPAGSNATNAIANTGSGAGGGGQSGYSGGIGGSGIVVIRYTLSANVQDGAIYYDTDLNKEYVLYNNTWTEV